MWLQGGFPLPGRCALPVVGRPKSLILGLAADRTAAAAAAAAAAGLSPNTRHCLLIFYYTTTWFG